jgi:hypothetical protein
MDKLSELSKPVAWVLHTRGGDVPTLDECYVANAEGMENIHSSPLYSQEYVSALLQRIAELEKKERHTERQDVIDGLAGAGEAWSDIEEYMVKWDEERRNG